MTQLVFIHGPGAGGCAHAWKHQLVHFPGSLAPTLPGNLYGTHCPDTPRYMEWLRGWLWAQGLCKDLVLVGYTSGSSVALQYGLDYPEEIKGLVLATVAAGPQGSGAHNMDMRLKAASGDPDAYAKWLDFQRSRMIWIDPAFRDELLDLHRKVGPMAQYKMLDAHHRFNVRDRIHLLKPKLLMIRGVDDPVHPPETEQEIQQKLPLSTLVRLRGAGHFPPMERPAEVNKLIEDFLAEL